MDGDTKSEQLTHTKMSKIKLYTEEQVKRAIDIADDNADLLEYDDILSKLTPIELPSDEETERIELGSGMHDFYKGGFIEGAKWVIEKIKQQVIP